MVLGLKTLLAANFKKMVITQIVRPALPFWNRYPSHAPCRWNANAHERDPHLIKSTKRSLAGVVRRLMHLGHWSTLSFHLLTHSPKELNQKIHLSSHLFDVTGKAPPLWNRHPSLTPCRWNAKRSREGSPRLRILVKEPGEI
jgi:hypothetical protein